MGTVSKFGSAEKRLLDPSNAALEGQARVNAEIFTAVEILGRKLERVEAERDRLARRLALIESSATVDEKTGKLFLPALTTQSPAPVAVTPKWVSIAATMSSALALFAVGIVLFRDPAPALTKEQVALLESLRTTQFTQLSPDSKGWKSLDSAVADTASAVPPPSGTMQNTPAPVTQQAAAAPEPPAAQPVPLAAAPAAAPAPQPDSATAAQLPSSTELAKLEQTAEAPKPVTAPSLPGTPALLTPAEKTATANTPEADPQTTLIPGEDTIPEKASAKIAKQAAAHNKPAPAQADSEDAAATGNNDTKTGTAVATSVDAGGIAPDPALPKKLALLQKRAYKGVPEAQHDLATLYAAGTSVPQDYHRAAFWFTKAAEAGVANANYNMGVIYHQGLGVPVNMAKALDWYARAAELGHPEAMYNLGIAYIEGIGTKTDIPKGVSYFKRAAKAGVVQAAYNLGVLYESNFIGPIDTKKAAEWYKVAAKAGHKGAQDALARLEAKGDLKGDVAATDPGAQAETLADRVEPSAGGDEESGEGDSSPVAKSSNLNNGPHTLLADIQRILIKRGLLPGKPDGVLSQQTEDAIRATQRKFGLTEDGQPSQELLEKLLQAPPG